MKKTVFFLLIMAVLAGSGFSSTEVLPTGLKITIRNDLGNLESGVIVTLYKSKDDFEKEQNMVMKGYTNEKGVVSFKQLDAIAYYISAVKGDMNNYGAGVQTDPLEANKINKVTIIIE